jgi:plasmid stabilization system protein ParE
MSLQIRQEPEAAAEFQEASAWYEAQASGLGIRFVLAVDKVISTICAQPLRFPRAGAMSQRARVLGWPCTIYFVFNEGARQIKIIAVWHGKRNPAELRRRLL